MLNTKLLETNTFSISDTLFKELINADLEKIIQIVLKNGFDIRIVGGAVRDILLEQAPRDIDMLTDASPEEIIFMFADNEIDADAYGIRHGTVKVIFGEEKYEVTSLNYSVSRDNNNKIIVHRNDGSWENDSKRRDFTVNAMSMTLDGTVYDYLNGLQDLREQRIRPIGDLDYKISKDPVIVMRFFKMLAKFENPTFSKSDLETVKKNIKKLDVLSSSRLQKELGNIQKSINAEKTIKLMDKIGLSSYLSERADQ